MNTPVTNWAGNLTFNATRVHRPESVEEMCRIVKNCDQAKAIGSGHSFSPVADTTGDLIRLDGLPSTVEIDPVNSTAKVAAGMRYADVAPRLHRAGFALPNLAALPHLSLAGACATGTHGSGDHQRVLAAHISGLQWVGPDGDLHELNRATHPDIFAGTVVALGALGVVTEMTLDLVPAFELNQWVRQGIPLTHVAAHFDEMFAAAYSVSAFTDWQSDTATVWLKQHTGPTPVALQVGEPASHPIHPTPGISPQSCTEQLGAAGPWHERLPHFHADAPMWAGDELQSEYFLPRHQAEAAFTAVREIAYTVASVLLVSEVRTVRSDDLWLSPAYDQDSVTFHFTWVKDAEKVLPVTRQLEERLAPLGARPHWGKITTMAPLDVMAQYPRSDDFRKLLLKYDPEGKFRNQFTDSYFLLAHTREE
ncbi:D-arabinono-1,4-lactone oxidase [Actinokineospora sp. 24-640]